ncbi:hypothetical protein LSAT2_028298 [Lamellibrachia satsuma]|nr:hypothetical protein LSAT2_028298 [Lamellibrachia satsuma]
MDALLAALVFALAISTAGAVTCYKCGDLLSIESPDECIDTKLNTSALATCEGTYCVKTKIVVLGLIQLVQRHCADEKNVKLDYSEYKCRTSKEPMTYCACSTDHCNGASNVAVSLSFLIAAVLSVFTLTRLS